MIGPVSSLLLNLYSKGGCEMTNVTKIVMIVKITQKMMMM